MNGNEANAPKPSREQPAADEQDDYDVASKDTSKYITEAFPNKAGKSGKNWKKPLMVLIVLLLLAGAGAATYSLLIKPKSDSDSTSPTTSTTTNTEKQLAKSTHYDSPNFSLGFDHPEGWKVLDTAGSGRLTAISPAMKLKDASGKEVTGQIIMTIRDKSQKLTELDKGNATAALESEKITYTKPTENQRGNTYISFLTFAETTTSGALDGIYVTGDNGYERDQEIPQTDIAKVDPVISITFIECDDNKCEEAGKPLGVELSSWDSISEVIKSVLQSLSIT